MNKQTEDLTNRTWDLIVLGGGLSGIAAAVTAKRRGLSVLLLEKAGYAGGAVTTMLVTPFMPYETVVDGEPFLLSRGFFTELREILSEVGAIGTKENKTQNTLHAELAKIALDRLILREGVEVLYHSVLAGVTKENGKIQSVLMATKAGPLSFKARYFIDATGNADLAMMSGCPFKLGRTDGLCQPMTLCFRIGNIDVTEFRANRELLQEKYKALKESGEIKNPREDVLYFRTLSDGVVHFNTTRVARLNPTDPYDVTKAEMEAREQMLEIYHLLREHIPGCEHCELLYSGEEIGIRESRMIEGEYTLTAEDLKNYISFPDRIAAGNYDLDIHNPEGTGTSHYFFPAGKWYTIPFRTMIPKNIENLLVTGRSISTTHEAQASIRIMPIVTTLGEAAGIGVSVAADEGKSLREADIEEIQRRLKENGAFIG